MEASILNGVLAFLFPLLYINCVLDSFERFDSAFEILGEKNRL
jgi:hypothetical protein